MNCQPCCKSTLECLIEGGFGINGARGGDGVGVENSSKLKRGEDSGNFNSRVWVKEILFDTLKLNSKKLKCFGLLSFSKNKFLTLTEFLSVNMPLRSKP